MRPMRRKDREVTAPEALWEIVAQCKVCRLGMQDAEGLYVVPLSFGYAVNGERLTLYFHCAKEGRKIDALQRDPRVCFEMDCAHRLVEGKTACAYGYSFKSVIGNGRASFLPDGEEKQAALAHIMKQQTGRDFVFTPDMARAVTVFKVEADSVCGKYHA